MIVGSAFSGIGGFDLACYRVGMTCAFQIELHPFRASILKRHFPEVPLYDDIFECGRTTDHSLRGTGRVQPGLDGRREYDPSSGERVRDGGAGTASRRILPGVSRITRDEEPAWQRAEELGALRQVERVRPVIHELPPIDLLTGGFPCRDLSVAGSRRGIDAEGTEDGSQLFFELARLADELVRPGGWLLVENVPGLLSSAGGRDFAVVLRTLGDLGFHDLAWRVLDSRYFGVPQRRRRVFVLARRADGRRARDVLLEPTVGGGDPASLLGEGKGTTAGANEGAETDISVLGGEVAHTLRGEGFDASEDGTGRGTPLIYTGHTRDGGLSMEREPEDGTPALRAPQGGAQHPLLLEPEVVGISENQRAEILETPYSRQITTGGGKAGQGYPAARVGSRVRRLTPTECERLQSFPDGWTIPRGPSLADAPSWNQLPPDEVPRAAEDPTPHGPRYEACGRAVTVSTVQWIVGRLVANVERYG